MELLASLDALSGLFVHRLELSDSGQIVDCSLVLLGRLVGEASSKVGLDQHVHILDVEGSIEHLGAVKDLVPIVLVFSIAEGNVTEDSCLKLSNLLLEDTKVLVCDLEDLGCVLVQLGGLSVCAFFEFDLGLLLGDLNLFLDLVKLGLKFLSLLDVQSGCGSSINDRCGL